MKNSLYHKCQDFITVARSAWFLILLNVLALAAFLLITQGQDVLLLVAERSAQGNHYFQLAGLLLAVFFWCVASEFSTRILVYLGDNSGRSLDPVRVDNRKKYQVWLGRIAVFYPVLLMIAAFLKVFFIISRISRAVMAISSGQLVWV